MAQPTTACRRIIVGDTRCVREVARRELEHRERRAEGRLHDHHLGDRQPEVVPLEDREDRHREQRHHQRLVDAEQGRIAREASELCFGARGVGGGGHAGPRRARRRGFEERWAGLPVRADGQSSALRCDPTRRRCEAFGRVGGKARPPRRGLPGPGEVCYEGRPSGGGAFCVSEKSSRTIRALNGRRPLIQREPERKPRFLPEARRTSH